MAWTEKTSGSASWTELTSNPTIAYTHFNTTTIKFNAANYTFALEFASFSEESSGSESWSEV